MCIGTKDMKPMLSTPGSEGEDGDGRASGSQAAIDSGNSMVGIGSKGQKVAGGAQGAVHVKEASDVAAAGATTEGELFFQEQSCCCLLRFICFLE